MISETALKEIPPNFLEYVQNKTKKNGEGGRPHFLQVLAKDHDAVEETLNIVELAWVKNRPLGEIARKYQTHYDTIYRILHDLEPWKAELADYLLRVPRRKKWYIPELDQSDYETVQAYIKRAKRDGLHNYAKNIKNARRCWTQLNYKDPENWNADEVCEYLATLKPVAQSYMLDGIRQVAPHLKEEIKTGRFREKISRRKKDIFGSEVQLIHEALKDHEDIKTVWDLHITLGAREGKVNSESGLAGIRWDRFKENFSRLDLYESKVRGGIWWRDCPIDLFFKDLPDRLRALWIKRGKPTNEKLLLEGYKEITRTYKQLREILNTRYNGEIEPSLLKEFITLRPHDSDKIHVNLLWEAEIPLEVVAGQFIGRGEGIGLMGRGWLDINVIKKHYLSLTQRSERFKKLRDNVRAYSERFNGGSHD
jgi:hypothetical protein